MSDDGYVYVLINPSLDGMVNIGKTTRTPEERAKELSSSAGVPTPFYVAYQVEVSNCHSAEEYMHTLLSLEGYNRVSENREFFHIPLNEAIKLILDVESNFNVGNSESYSEPFDDANTDIDYSDSWASLESRADDYRLGYGGRLRNDNEAIKLYKQAAMLGSVTSCIALSEMCEEYDEALHWLKTGVKNGGGVCHALMAELFVQTRHKQSAEECWERYFLSDDFWGYKSGDYYSVSLSIQMEYISMVNAGKINHKLKGLLNSIRMDTCKKAKLHLDSQHDANDKSGAEQKYFGLVRFFKQVSKLAG